MTATALYRHFDADGRLLYEVKGPAVVLLKQLQEKAGTTL